MSGFKPLVVCLLTFFGIILGHDNGLKVVVKEGSDAVLPCSLNTTEDITKKLFDWKKDGQKEVFIYDDGKYYGNGFTSQDEQFKGQVSHFQDQLMNGNASIKIHNTKMADSGNYSCIFPHLQPSQTFYIELVVERLLRDRSGETGASKPCTTILNATKDWALLQCEVRGASPKPKVKWQDSAGNILPAEEPQVSERGGRYYVTLNTTVTKTDRYRCVVTQEEISHQTFAEIYVFISGASPKPCTTILDDTKDWALLQCELRGAFPKPKVEWQDSAGNILPAEEPQVSERGGSYYVTLNTTVTKTDRYRCVATQEEISHQTFAETKVFISEKLCEDPSSKVVIGWLGGIVVGAVVLAAVQAVLVATKSITVTCNRDLLWRRCSRDDPDDPEIVMSSKSPLSNGDAHPPHDPEIALLRKSSLSNGGPCRQGNDYQAAPQKPPNSPL